MVASMLRKTSETGPQGRNRFQRRVLLADPSQEYLVYVPSSRRDQAPMVVSVHGRSRNADEHVRLLAGQAEMYGAVLVAPIFSAEQHPDYQRLGRVGRGKRADNALNMIVAEAAALTGAVGDRFYLFGFSAGAQFAHRYMMANPHRVAAAVIASAGWYTFPDATSRFPYGIRLSKTLPNVQFDAEEFLSVPVAVIVGEHDNSQAGLRRTARLDREQGVTRVERARSWVDAMQAAARAHHLDSKVSYEEVANCNHSFQRSILRGGLGDRVFRTLMGPLPASTREQQVVA